MLKSIVLISVIAFACVVCDLKDFPDRDAFFLAQYWNESVLEPSKQSYDQVVKELSAVRKAYPEVKDIHLHPTIVPGKIFCFNIDLRKLNDSKEFGPIRVEGVGQQVLGHERLLITFTKPFNPTVLDPILIKKFPGKVDDVVDGNYTSRSVGCGTVTQWGAKSIIRRSQFPKIDPKDKPSPIYYDFETASSDCFLPLPFQCPNYKELMFEIDAELMEKTGEIKIKKHDLSVKPTTTKF